MFNSIKKKDRNRKNDDKDGKVLQKLMNNAVYGKWTSKPSYMSQKIFDNCLIAILKNKVA